MKIVLLQVAFSDDQNNSCVEDGLRMVYIVYCLTPHPIVSLVSKKVFFPQRHVY